MDQQPLIKYIMNEKLRRGGEYSGAEAKIRNMLSGYRVLGDVIALPDFTDSNALPVGTVAVIGSEKAINPAMIGMDIGCGYSFFSADMNPGRFFRKGKFRENGTSLVVQEIDHAISTFERNGDRDFATIGKGNHFIDMYVPEEIYAKQTCKQFGIEERAVYFLVHTGSRDMGFQVNATFSELFKQNPNPAEFNESYLAAFAQARKYAQANRAQLKVLVEKALEEMHGGRIGTRMIFDKAHNDISVIERGQTYKLRKGAAKLGAGDIFVIPGNCSDPAYVVTGLPGLKETHYSINHGCGRKYTRAQMFCRFRRTDFDEFFNTISLNVRPSQMIEEMPKSYKPIEEVVSSAEEAGLVKRIAKLRPVGVVVERK